MLPEELEQHMLEMGQPRYRASQLFTAINKNPASFSSLPKTLKKQIDLHLPEIIASEESADGTIKLLFRLSDGEAVESVILDYDGEKTLCISSQAGCRQGCAFCASTEGGLVRGLTAGEMAAQVILCGESVNRIVIMGIGEPLDNYENTIRFLRLISHPEGRGMSLRRVSLSTSGFVPEILKLAELNLGITLSVSLHAPDDETRSKIMPVNNRWGVRELIHSCKIYFDKTGRRNSYEYVMIKAVNDSIAQAKQLVSLLKGQPAHVNIIRLNPVRGKDLEPSDENQIAAFCKVLNDSGLSVTSRRRLGTDINAACGQLRKRRITLVEK